MKFHIGQTFENSYPAEAAVWCNTHRLCLEKNEKGGFVIKEPLLKTKDVLERQIREKRNNLLFLTDKFMLADYPISEELKEAYKTYRQALRDMTTQAGFPENAVFPKEP